MLCRNAERGGCACDEIRAAANNPSVEVVTGDLSSPAKVRTTASALLDQVPEIRVLINNAGIWATELHHNEDGIELSFALNHLAPFLLSHLLLERLQASAPGRIVNVSASLYTTGEVDLEKTPVGEDFHPMRTYSNTKLCNILFTREFARRFNGSGVAMNAVHPGVIRSNLAANMSGGPRLFVRMGQLFGGSPERGAEGPLYLATSDDVSDITGSYFEGRKQKPYVKNALDDELASQLWEKSAMLTGLC
jgi:NAD(P)-dependent dehydrogenase (short-subunit alcohol dehydrogenase family)